MENLRGSHFELGHMTGKERSIQTTLHRYIHGTTLQRRLSLMVRGLARILSEAAVSED